MTQTYHLQVPQGFHGERLDKFLAVALPKISRAQAQKFIELGHVKLAGAECRDASRKLSNGQALQVIIPDAKPADLAPADIPLTVLYEDAHLLVVNKPAGLTVHPAPGEKGPTLVHALLHHCGTSLSGIGGVARPGIVHRIDKDTSGAIIVAKNDAAHQALSAQLQDRTLSRTYHALVYGLPNPATGTWEGNIGRSPRNRKKMAVVNGGKPARTHYKVLEVFGKGALSLIECKLETGRTHQIRVHASHHGCPLIGDQTYAARPRKLQDETLRALASDFPRQALHAVSLSFKHPKSGEIISCQAEYPSDFDALMRGLRAN